MEDAWKTHKSCLAESLCQTLSIKFANVAIGEHARCPGVCRAVMDLQKGTQGEHVPAECLSGNEKKATFSFYLSLTIYNGWVTQRKGLNKKKAVTCYCQ